MKRIRGKCISLVVFAISIFFIVFISSCGGGGGGASYGGYSGQNNLNNNNDDPQLPAEREIAFSGTLMSEGAGSGSRTAADVLVEHITNAGPLSGATITLTPQSGDPIQVTSDAAGVFELEADEVEDGVYELVISDGDVSVEFYVILDGDEKELLAEFTDAGDCYTEIVKAGTSDWERNIEPDGTYTIEEGGSLVEQHLENGLTGLFDDSGEEDWFLDRNGNMVDDGTDPDAPALTEEEDTDDDGCHDIMDFDDDDNDNDSNINFDDNDYNANLLAAYIEDISVNCINTSPMFFVELAVAPSEGDAPLTVNAEVLYKGEKRSIEKFEWRSGIPGTEPVETTEPETTLVYDRYGTFILTVILHHKSGKKIVDTHPILVRKPGAVTAVTELGTFEPGCYDSECSTLDVDVDQYGNIFVLASTWGDYDNSFMSIHSPDTTAVDSVVFDLVQREDVVNLTVDGNGFIYVLETMDRYSVMIFNSMGTLVREISLSEFGGFASFKGLVVAENGDVFIGHGISSDITLIKCDRSEEYACSVMDQIAIAGGFIGVLDVDLDITSDGNIAILAGGSVFYYTQEGESAGSFTPPYGINLFHLAIGPNDEVFVSDNDSVDVADIYAYDSGGNLLYSFESPCWNWGIYVDELGIIYVTTYEDGTVIMYAPDYITGQDVARAAAREPEVPGFNIRRVKVVRLDG